MKKFFRALRALLITVTVIATVVTVKSAADYICKKYKKRYISI